MTHSAPSTADQPSSMAQPMAAGRKLQLLLLSAVATAAVLATATLTPLQEAIRVGLELSDDQIAFLQGPAIALPLAFGGIPVGLLIDRISRVRLIFALTGIGLIGTLLTAMTSNFAMLLAARCLVGLAAPGILMTLTSLIADLYTPEHRGRAYICLSYGGLLGTPAAFAVGGMLMTLYRSDPNGWRWTLCWLSTPLILVLFLIVAMREPTRTGVVVENPSVRTAFRELWRYRSIIMPLQVSMIMVGIVDTASLVWAMPALSRSFNVSPEHVSEIMAVATLVSGVAGPALGGFLADLCQRRGGPHQAISILSGLVFLSAPAGLFAIMSGIVSASILLTVFMTLGSAIALMGTSIATVVIPNELRGLYIASMTAVSAPFSTGLAPLAVSMQASAMGGGPAMIQKALALVCVTISLLGAVLLGFARRHISTKPEVLVGASMSRSE